MFLFYAALQNRMLRFVHYHIKSHRHEEGLLAKKMIQILIMVIAVLIGYPILFAKAQNDSLVVPSPFLQRPPEGIIVDDRIQEIRIEGAQRIEDTTILSYLQVVQGDRFDLEKLDASLKALFETGLFVDVVLRRQGNTLIIEVLENRVIDRVVFEGNDLLSDEDLSTDVQIAPLTVYTQTLVQNTVQRILDLYLQRNRFLATVQPMIIQLEQNRVDLIFVIDEGPRTSIARINFIGNHIYSDSTLRSELLTRESAWWRILSVSDTYDPDQLALDTASLQQFYLTRGYADFQVLQIFSMLSLDHRDFFITIVIEEGLRYKVGSVELITTLYNLDLDSLRDELTTEQGDWYNADDIEDSINALNEAIRAHTLFFQVIPSSHP